MLAFNPSLQWVYPSFVLLVFCLMAVVYWARADLRRQIGFIFVWGAIGGLAVGSWHRVDFWNPPSWGDITFLGLYWSPWDALFGGSFSGIATVLVQLFGHKFLVPEAVPPHRKSGHRLRKVIRLAVVLVIGPVCYFWFRWDSLTSAIVVYACGTAVFYSSRRNLRRVVLPGTFFIAVMYGLIVGVFLAVLGNPSELATTISPFYVKHGAVGTGIVLTLFALSYGAFISPLFGWVTNQRYADS